MFKLTKWLYILLLLFLAIGGMTQPVALESDLVVGVAFGMLSPVLAGMICKVGEKRLIFAILLPALLSIQPILTAPAVDRIDWAARAAIAMIVCGIMYSCIPSMHESHAHVR